MHTEALILVIAAAVILAGLLLVTSALPVRQRRRPRRHDPVTSERDAVLGGDDRTPAGPTDRR